MAENYGSLVEELLSAKKISLGVHCLNSHLDFSQKTRPLLVMRMEKAFAIKYLRWRSDTRTSGRSSMLAVGH
jgi:hypothetical protein